MRQCRVCGDEIPENANWNRVTCYWHSTYKGESYYQDRKKMKVKTKEEIVSKINIGIDKASVEYDKIEKIKRGQMRQLWLQEYIERHR